MGTAFTILAEGLLPCDGQLRSDFQNTGSSHYFRLANYSPGGIRNSKELRLKAMEAWRTTCPRHSVWEDALIDGHNPGRKRGGTNESKVTLYASGQRHTRQKSQSPINSS